MLTMSVEFQSEGVVLSGELTLPEGCTGLAVFAHGSGSSRHSPRNRHVAEVLQEAGVGTLLFDLLTLDEEKSERVSAHLRFDTDLLARRLLDATAALRNEQSTRRLPIGYFGAETGTAAALLAAAQKPTWVAAIVSRSGRPDLVEDATLQSVRAPTLFIAGERDSAIVGVNRRATVQMGSLAELRIVSGAGDSFEEPPALDRVASLARDWFDLYFTAIHAPSPRTARPARGR